jgi:hypothetical protein
VDGDRDDGLLDEDGALETGKGQFSIEPFLLTEKGLQTWAEGTATQTFAPSELRVPAPAVTRTVDSLQLLVTVHARGTPGHSWLEAMYGVDNQSSRARHVTLFLAIRPFQVNPPTQFLNLPGGVARIDSLSWHEKEVLVNGERHVSLYPRPDRFSAVAFDQGDVVAKMESGALPRVTSAADPAGRASGVAAWTLELAAYGSKTVWVEAPFGDASPPEVDHGPNAELSIAVLEELTRQHIKEPGSLAFSLPDASYEVVATLRTQLMYVLVNRDSAGIQPGSRSYARSWIRDGALTSSALLHAGMAQPVKEFLLWYADHQYADGKVPCCVDKRGSDPVPENDSHGEFVFLAAEYLRLTGDRATVERVYPHVRAAVAYMDTLRAQRLTPEWRRPENAPYHGLLPPSISHEGYSAKPMHSYWDDLFALRGYKDGTWLAAQLGKKDDVKWMAKSRDEFARDFSKAAVAAMKAHHIDYVPGCSDLGDFDATSTTIALNPVQAAAVLPASALERTFARYWEFFVKRRDGVEAWDAFTPYEMRNIGAFVRLGWRDRANELLEWFMQFRRPAGWREWAEVVDHDPRHARFIGDMPHTWVGTDFVRSVMDMLAYERESDSTLVLCAGIPEKWMAGGGVNVNGLRTRWGTVGFTLRRKGDVVRFTLDSSALRVPPGGIELAPPIPSRGSNAWIGPAATQVGTGFVKLDADGRYRWRASGANRTPPPELEWTFKAPAGDPH